MREAQRLAGGVATPVSMAGNGQRKFVLATASLFAVPGAAYLLTQHSANTLSYLPYLLLAACPLMHYFHHGRHH